MTVSDDDIERLCKSMKETAMRNTWQDSEKSKIKDVTKNVLISWGVLKEVEVILSILVDTFISKISFPMQPGPEIGSISDA